jgi:hypothetical protein
MQAENWPWKDSELAERPNGNLGSENDWAGVRSPDWSDVGERKSTARQVLHTTRSNVSLKDISFDERCNTCPFEWFVYAKNKNNFQKSNQARSIIWEKQRFFRKGYREQL